MPESAIYDPRKMVQALEINPAPKSFLQTTFFGDVIRHETTTVEFDVEVSKRRIAGYTHPSSAPKMVEREGFHTKSVEPAYIKEMTVMRVSDLTKRLPAEDPFSPLTVEQREIAIVGKDQRMLDGRINRREEVMCAEALLTGKIIVKGDGFDEEVDFGYIAGQHLKVLTGPSAWNNAGGDPMLDLKAWKTEINQRCGVRPTMAIVGAEVGNALIDNEKVVKRLDTRRIDLGVIDPKELPNGIDYIGTLKPSNLDIYVYEEWFIDPADDTEKPVIPDDVVLVGSAAAECSMHYGLIENLKCLKALRRFPHSYVKEDGSSRVIQLESAPMPCIKNPNAFVVAHVLV